MSCLLGIEKFMRPPTYLHVCIIYVQDKLERADKLVSGLAGEFVRWQASIGTFESMIERLVGDSLIAAAFLSYAGTFDTIYRYITVIRRHACTPRYVRHRTVLPFLRNCCSSTKASRTQQCIT